MDFKYDAFISYSHKDKEWVEKFIDKLEQKGVRVWWDEHLELGKKYVSKLEEALRKSRAFLLVISKDSVDSGWVESESHVIQNISNNPNNDILVIPVIKESAKIPEFLATYQGIDFQKEEMYDINIDKLAKSLIAHPPITNLAPLDEESFELHQILRQAKKSVIVSGNTLSKFTSDERVKDALKSLLRQGKKLTVILLNPSCSYAKAHEVFHTKESTRNTMRSQFNKTIEFLSKITEEPKKPDGQYSVYLSNYMPRFRTILIDDAICYVYLYMYGTDVTHTPEFKITADSDSKNARWFKTIKDSVDELLESNHIFPIIEDTTFYKEWPETAIHLTLLNCLKTRCCIDDECKHWDVVRRNILGYQNTDDRRAIKDGVCGENYKPGTYTIADAPALQTPMEYNQWIDRILDDHITLLKETQPDLFEGKSEKNIKKNTRALLALKPKGFVPLKKEIWFQEYSDIIHRMIMILLEQNAERFGNLCPHLTTEKEDFMRRVIEILEQGEPDLKEWLHLSIAAGLLGVDRKSIHAATTSVIALDQAIKIEDDRHKPREPRQVARELMQIARNPKGRDDADKFFEILERSTCEHFNMVAFTDDYLETMVLLKFYEKLLAQYELLTITCVPRSIRCSNDATYQDVVHFLSQDDSFLKELNEYYSSDDDLHKRFKVLSYGPKLGGVNLRKLDEKLIAVLAKADLIDVRGARNYEMMQEINKEIFFGFMVCRDISSQVTGLEIKNRPFFYIYQEPGQCSFAD